MVDYGEEIRKRGGEWRGDTLNANTLLLLFDDRIRAATDGRFYICYDQRGLVTFRSACQSSVNGRERAEKWIIENWEKVMVDGCEDVSPVGSLPPVPDGYEAVGEWRLFSGKEYQYMPIEGRRWLLGNGDVTSCGVDFKMWARPIMEVDPIDAMSDAEAIAEVERVSGLRWGQSHPCDSHRLASVGGVSGSYGSAGLNGSWFAWGGPNLVSEVARGWSESTWGARAAASRALLRHWRDNPSDAPKPKAKVHREDIDAACQALCDAGISEPESIADGIRTLTKRADGYFDQLGEVQQALVDAGILDFDGVANGVRALVARESRVVTRLSVSERTLDDLNEAMRTIRKFVGTHDRGWEVGR